MTEVVYLSLWSVYGISVLLAFLLLWRLTRWQKGRSFGRLLRFLFLVVMLTPANLSTEPDFMAPAFVVATFDFLQGYEDGAFDASINLGVAVVATLIIYAIFTLILFIVHSRKARRGLR